MSHSGDFVGSPCRATPDNDDHQLQNDQYLQRRRTRAASQRARRKRNAQAERAAATRRHQTASRRARRYHVRQLRELHAQEQRVAQSRRNDTAPRRATRKVERHQRQLRAQEQITQESRRDESASRSARIVQLRDHHREERSMCTSPLLRLPESLWPQDRLGLLQECQFCFGLLWKGQLASVSPRRIHAVCLFQRIIYSCPN